MKKLIITAHPSSQGFTHKIAEVFMKKSQEIGHEVRLLNLYEENAPYLRFNSERDLYQNPHNEIINWADEYILIFPIWWYGSPAIMKNFFDSNFVAGLAYKYVHGIPMGLFQGKTVRFFCTSGGTKWLYYLRIAPTIGTWKTRFKFCGIKTKSFIVFGPKSKRTEEEIEKQLKIVEKIAQK